MGKIISIVLLLAGTIGDIKTKTISVWIPILGIVFAVINLPLADDIYQNLFGMLFGLLMILASIITKNRLGMADGLFAMAVGGLTGAYFCIESVLVGLILAALTGIILMIFYNKKKEYELPFIPYMLLGVVAVSIAEVIG